MESQPPRDFIDRISAYLRIWVVSYLSLFAFSCLVTLMNPVSKRFVAWELLWSPIFLGFITVVATLIWGLERLMGRSK